jgi:hypothetical protein
MNQRMSSKMIMAPVQYDFESYVDKKPEVVRVKRRQNNPTYLIVVYKKIKGITLFGKR